MTTERTSPIGRTLRHLATGAVVGMSVWTSVLAASAFLQPADRPIAILTPAGGEAALMAAVNAGGRIIEVRDHAVIAISDDQGFVRRLYAQTLLQAPLLAVPARKGGGCGFGRLASADNQAAAYLRWKVLENTPSGS